ncbi:protein-tyrosine phosphatase-like protein [Thamnidium elegans]|nr:protein-tyrosine phosphatase-like protein [Thamnidium elegans]
MSVTFESPTRHVNDNNSLYSASDNESCSSSANNTPYNLATNTNIHQDFLNVIQARQQNFQLQSLNTGWSKKTLPPLYRQPIEDLAPIDSKRLNQLMNQTETLLIIDLRSFNYFVLGRIKSAINVSIPSILLKRASYSIEKVCELIKYDDKAADHLKHWSNATHIIFYDHYSYSPSDSGNSATAILLGSKLRAAGYKGQLNYLQGGIKIFSELYPDQCAGPLEESKDKAKARVKRPNSIQLPLPTSTNINRSSASVNPFFSNIRQNLELSHGPLKERFHVRLPWGLQNEQGIISSSLSSPASSSSSISSVSNNTHHPRFGLAGSSVDKHGNFVLPSWIRDIMDIENGPKKLAEMYEQLERVEQERLYTVMKYHSQQDQSNENFPFSITASMEKGVLNRYDNIWPFAYSRVRLTDKSDDYINANYIQYANIKKDITLSPIHQSEQELKLQKQGLLSQESIRTMNKCNVELDCNRQYISTQGPLPTTFDDFWKLIWYENSSVIVMLTQEMEMNKIKCHRYWPSIVQVPQVYGKITVTLLSESKHSVLNMNDKRERDDPGDEHIIIRKFKLQNQNKERTITHLQYTGWTDFGVPDQPIGILQLIHYADEAARYHQLRNEQVGPMTVHCSAGCGRSGTFCVIDTIIQRLWHEQDVYTSTTIDKIQQTVSRFREQRMSLVQTHRQFVFCYEAVLWWLLGYGYLPASSSSSSPIITTTTNFVNSNLYARSISSNSVQSFDFESKKPLDDDGQSSSIGSIVDDFKDL